MKRGAVKIIVGTENMDIFDHWIIGKEVTVHRDGRVGYRGKDVYEFRKLMIELAKRK